MHIFIMPVTYLKGITKMEALKEVEHFHSFLIRARLENKLKSLSVCQKLLLQQQTSSYTS